MLKHCIITVLCGKAYLPVFQRLLQCLKCRPCFSIFNGHASRDKGHGYQVAGLGALTSYEVRYLSVWTAGRMHVAGPTRFLCPLLHTNVTMMLLEDGTHVHTQSKQKGTSLLMLEMHLSKLTATMAAARLA